VYAACLMSEALTPHDAFFFKFFQNDCGNFVDSDQMKSESDLGIATYLAAYAAFDKSHPLFSLEK
jgi:hypothetical protein